MGHIQCMYCKHYARQIKGHMHIAIGWYTCTHADKCQWNAGEMSEKTGLRIHSIHTQAWVHDNGAVLGKGISDTMPVTNSSLENVLHITLTTQHKYTSTHDSPDGRLTGSPDIRWNILTGCQLKMEHLEGFEPATHCPNYPECSLK